MSSWEGFDVEWKPTRANRFHPLMNFILRTTLGFAFARDLNNIALLKADAETIRLAREGPVTALQQRIKSRYGWRAYLSWGTAHLNHMTRAAFWALMVVFSPELGALSPETAAEVSAPSGESHLRQEELRNTQSRKAQAVREKLEARQQAIAEIQRKKAMGEDLADEQERVAKKSRREIHLKDYLGQAPDGVSEAWNEYADAFNDTCKQNSASIDAHCEECSIIGTRLKGGHLLASGTCDDALDYQQSHGTSKSDR